jgi:hypothetical protein
MIQFVNSKTGKLLLSWLDKVWAALSGRSQSLLDLTTLQVTNLIVDYHYAGLQTVPLHQIRGSASPYRCYDFDANFRLLQSRMKSRWEGISTARRRGAKLPPVSLIQVGEIYFVEDGHHRISVAKAWREQAIEADVTVWQIAAPLPWHSPHP